MRSWIEFLLTEEAVSATGRSFAIHQTGPAFLVAGLESIVLENSPICRMRDRYIGSEPTDCGVISSVRADWYYFAHEERRVYPFSEHFNRTASVVMFVDGENLAIRWWRQLENQQVPAHV